MIGQILEYNTVVTKAEFLFMSQSVNLPPSAHTITFSAHCSSHYIFSAHCSSHYIFSAHCSSHYIFSAHTAAAITSSVHTSAMYSYLQPIFSAHFSHVQPCTAICSQSSVHTAANCSHLQPPTLQLFYPVHTAAILSSAHCSLLSSAHCSYTIQCTLQLYCPMHTAATLSIQYIQCTFEPPQGKPIPLLAYLQSSQQTLMVDCSSP